MDSQPVGWSVGRSVGWLVYLCACRIKDRKIWIPEVQIFEMLPSIRLNKPTTFCRVAKIGEWTKFDINFVRYIPPPNPSVPIFTARSLLSSGVRLLVRHVGLLYPDGWRYRQISFSTQYLHDSSLLHPAPVSNSTRNPVNEGAKYRGSPITYRFLDKRRFQSKMATFSYPVYFASPLSGSSWNCVSAHGVEKNYNDVATGPIKKFDDIFSRVDTTHQRDRQTDGRTDTGRQYRPRLYA